MTMTTSANKVAVLFPGQGSQHLGMGREFLETSEGARRLMAAAEEVTSIPIRRLCLDGPLEELTQTVNLQPAITAVNLICWQMLEEAGVRPAFAAGHSLGEFSALCAADVLSAQDTLALVAERGRLMQREGEKHPGGMRAVLGLGVDEVAAALAARGRAGEAVVANHNSPKQVVISGDLAALEEVSPALSQMGGKVIPLNVSAAMHSPLLREAVPDFAATMAGITFRQPRIPVLFNVTGGGESEPAAIRELLARQIASRVRWVEILEYLKEKGVRIFIEVGPNKVLSGLVKKTLPKDCGFQCLQVENPDGLAKCLETLGLK